MNETPKNIIQTGHFITGKIPQPKIETPSHDDISGEENSHNTSSVAGATCVGMENPSKTTSEKAADFILVDYSRRRRSGRSAKANTGKKPPHPYNKVEGQLPQKNLWENRIQLTFARS